MVWLISEGPEKNFALESYGNHSKCFDHTDSMWEERSCRVNRPFICILLCWIVNYVVLIFISYLCSKRANGSTGDPVAINIVARIDDYILWYLINSLLRCIADILLKLRAFKFTFSGY